MKQTMAKLVDVVHFLMKNNRQDKLIKLTSTVPKRDMRNFDKMRRRPSSKKTDFNGYKIKSSTAADHQQ